MTGIGQADIAAYSAAAAYTVGDRCTSNGYVFKCIAVMANITPSITTDYTGASARQWEHENLIDDQIAALIRNVLINHRNIAATIINWIRSGHNPGMQELTAMTADMGEYGDCLRPRVEGNGYSFSLRGCP